MPAFNGPSVKSGLGKGSNLASMGKQHKWHSSGARAQRTGTGGIRMPGGRGPAAWGGPPQTQRGCGFPLGPSRAHCGRRARDCCGGDGLPSGRDGGAWSRAAEGLWGPRGGRVGGLSQWIVLEVGRPTAILDLLLLICPSDPKAAVAAGAAWGSVPGPLGQGCLCRAGHITPLSRPEATQGIRLLGHPSCSGTVPAWTGQRHCPDCSG